MSTHIALAVATVAAPEDSFTGIDPRYCAGASARTKPTSSPSVDSIGVENSPCETNVHHDVNSITNEAAIFTSTES